MAEYVHLIGAEQVQNAARSMQSAADTMRQAMSYHEEALRRHQSFMDDWLARLEATIERIVAAPHPD